MIKILDKYLLQMMKLLDSMENYKVPSSIF